MTESELGTLIKRLREEQNLSQKELAHQARVKRSWLSHVETGERKKPEPERLERVAVALSIPPAKLLALAGHRAERAAIMPELTTEQLVRLLELRVRDVVRIPILGHVPAGDLFPEEQEPVEVLPLPKVWLRGATRPYLLIVNGDSMAGNLESGDLVLVDPDGQWTNGKVVVVRVEHETTVKRIFRDNDKVRLVPDNKKHKAIEVKEQDVIVLGVVIKRIRAEDL